MLPTMTYRPSLLVLLMLTPLASLPAQELGGCPMFPRNNIWNVAIDQMPVHSSSARFIESEGPDRSLHPEFSKAGGIPFIVVPATQPMVPIALGSAESDPGPYPIPNGLPIEPGPADSDTHGLILRQGECKLYEIYQAGQRPDGSWKGSSGAVFDLRRNGMRPDGWTSADAAGLSILAGLVRRDEIEAGEIRHAIRLTVPKTRNSYVWPARHFASRLGDVIYPPMGTRFRLKASYDISGFPAEVQVLLRALKKYGMIVADNGQSWFLTGATDSRWNDDVWATIKRIKGTDIEAVDASSLMISPNSAQAGTVATLGRNDVPYSPNPVFDFQAGSTQFIRLTGDVIEPVAVNGADGQQVSIVVCQDDAGNRNFNWPAKVRGGMRVGLGARTCSAQQFVINGDLLLATSPGVTDLPID